ncbi:thiamine pyrophosphate-binding protein [Aquabacterium sp. CECT 9606]|uniref:thiamine pyrophosphate-binding protein n=1 Tax=Aquabacterium sp. CECT 9606 TaxID=2845822 RepID=UPI001E41799B|nr:thiamine pyrophosphate-binding protein [Aquabacterium sp. CECT 9606]CAH0350829.1 Putative acetolactate synthase large subunit IlvB2 [Aquabacterium sp. CECT 9606]
MQTTVAQLLLDYLKAEGVTKIFGIPGGALVWLMNELKLRQDIDYVICRHETGAAYMADGYARAGGGLGVVMTTSGPGATNAVTGAMNAQAANSSMLVVTGEVPEKYFGQGYLQEGADAKLDITSIFRNSVQSSDMISNQSNFQTLFQQALRNACSLPRRAAHISLPNDVAGTPLSSTPASIQPRSYRAVAACTDAKAVAATLRELIKADRPLLFLGNGCREALADPHRLAAFTHFVERFGIPVMTTPNAKGIFPETHAWSLRNYGMCGSAWTQLYMKPPTDPDHVDTLVVMGSTLGELATSVVASDLYSRTLSPRKHFVQIDLDASVIGRDFPITRGVVAELGATLDELCEQATRHAPDEHRVEQRRDAIAQIKRAQAPWADPAGRDSTSAPVHPAAMMRVINEALADGHIFIDAGNCVGWSLNNLVVDPPLRYQSALAMGPMGFAVAAVIGAKLAAPEQPCLAIVGDGAFMMHGAEISTAAQNGVGAIWVVLNDNDLAMVSQGMAQLLPPAAAWTDYYQLGRPDLVKFAEGLGAQAVAIGPDQGTSALAEALSNALASAQSNRRPQVIVVHIDTKPAPPYGWPKLTT